MPERSVEELVVPAPAPVEVDEPAEEYVPAEAKESPIEPQSYQPALAPAPLAVPEATEIVPPTSTAPADEEPPTAEIVGDRYSNEGDLFGPTAPEESPTPEPVVEPAPETDDLFDELTPPAEAETPLETPLPEPTPEEPTPEESTPEQPTTEDPEPQPEMDVEDLFGPTEPASEPNEAEDTNEAEEPNEAEETNEPSQEPEESAPVESEPTDSEEIFDPFGEDLTTRLEERSSVLEAAGGLQSKAERTWTDSTATFRCEARLVRVTAKNVVLRQSTGAKLTVPLVRLADADLHFVHGQITALRLVRARDAAAEKLAVAWAR